ncbi:DUF4214 domain-containing protein [Roseovarius sp. D0-M9]|uniref:DUF4214 domain-containing protein n=1 Tax=Roseovarius sp. D0-M9 TaxID=3127117 RepID=UPI0030100139
MPINASADLTVQQQITAIYIAYYDRAPDPAGLQFWVDQVQAGRSLVQVASDFSTAAETKAKYPFFDAPDVASADTFITSIYTNLFGRTPDAEGQAFWSAQLSSGSTPVGEIILAILEGAQDVAGGNDDKTTVTNKIDVGLDWAESAVAAGIGLSNNPIAAEVDGKVVVNNQAAFDSATSILDNVDGTAASVTTAKATTDTFISGNANAGSNLTLTTSVENLTGTTNNDTFNGVVGTNGATLTAGDAVNGGAGVDTLNVTTVAGAADVLSGALVSNIEVVNVRATANENLTLNATGLTNVGLTGTNTGTTGLSNLANNATVTVGSGANLTGVITAGYAAAATTANLAYAGGTSGAVNVTGAGLTSASIATSGTANTAGSIDVAAAKAVTVGGSANLTATSIDTTAVDGTLTINGAGAFSLGTLDAGFDTVDASANTGGVTLTLDTEVDTKFTGGTGNDVITASNTAYVAANTAAIDAGAGTDTLVVGNGNALSTAASGAKFTGFETLEVQTNDTIDLDNIAGITSIVVDSAAVDLNDVSATQAGAITVQQDSTLDIAVKGAATVGQIDTVKITADDGLAATNTIALTTPVLANVEKLELVAVDNLTVSALTSATALTGVTASGAGTISITTGNVAFASNSTINASAATGAVTIDAGLANTNGLAITGSATAANTITGSTASDAIVGGTGIDTITNSAGTDTIDFGSDSANDVFNIANLTGKSTITNFDAATATTTEDLVNVSNDEVDGSEVAITGAGGQVALTDDATIVVTQTAGAAGSLTTGGTQALVSADFTAATLTNVAAYLSEKFTTAATTDQALVFLNDGTNTYAYHVNEGADAALDAGIQADEVSLVGVFNGAVLNAGDIYQTV